MPPLVPCGKSGKFRTVVQRAALLCLALVLGILSILSSTQAAPAVPVPFSQERILIIPKAGHDVALGNQHAVERTKVRRKFPGLGNIHILDLPRGADPQAVVERYRRNGHVDVATLDYQGWHPAATPNDPAFLNGVQWHLHNTGQNSGLLDADIDAPEAWDILNSATNVIVAVVDTGARVTHEDLAGNLWTSKAFASLNGNQTFTNDVTDEYNHGTHVTGILGAVGNNGVGVCGVAWKAKIIPLKFISLSSGYDSDFITCLDYARTNGARVINCSVVSGITEPALEAAFASLQSADIVVSAAAGNNGTDNDVSPVYPANYKFNNILSVTATDRSDIHYASGGAAANYGATSVHLAAPGVAIYSTLNGSDNDYGFITGTSMAAPMVSGAAALMRAKFTNETAPQIIRRLLNAVDVVPGLAGRCITGGRLNLRKALDIGSLPLFTVTNASYAWVPTNGMAALTFVNGDGVNGPLALPFSFPFYGRGYAQLWVGANGLIGVTTNSLDVAVNGNIPNTNAPNAIYPFWDNLDPTAGGSVWFGFTGIAPNRKAVVSWVAVPHMTASGGPFTFQAVLHESGQVAFQYAQVGLGQQSYTNGKSATVGIEDPSGLFGTRYRDFAVPTIIVTNNQALLFTPQVVSHPAPGLRLQAGPAGQSILTISGEPAQPGAVLFSTNLTSWSMVYSNLLPASGLAAYSQTNTVPQKFFRAVSGPFLQ